MIQEIHGKRPIYGYRRVTIAIRKQTGLTVNHKRVQRLMDVLGLKSIIRRKRYPKQPKFTANVKCPNLLAGNFHATRPGEKFVTDITYFFAGQNRYYLSTILDLYNGQVVAYHHGTRVDLSLVLETLKKWFARFPESQGAILHSDQGGHYTSMIYNRMLSKHGVIQSMSRGKFLWPSQMRRYLSF